MRQFIDGVEVISDREPPVRRAAHRDVTDAPPLPARFTPEAPTRRDEAHSVRPPAIAPPMLLESESEWLESPQRSESPEPLAPRPTREPAPDDEADEQWFDGTLQSDEPRPAPDTGGIQGWRWLAGAALVSSLAALSAWWLATR